MLGTWATNSFLPKLQDATVEGPVLTTLEYDEAEYADHTMAFPSKPSLKDDDPVLKVGENLTGFRSWSRKNNGVDVGISHLELSVRNERSAVVTIKNIRIRSNCWYPLEGALFWAPPESEVPPIEFGFNLDEEVPGARVVKPDGSLGDHYEKDIVLSKGDEQVIDMTVKTEERSCTWMLELDVWSGGEKEVVTAGEGTRETPLKTTASGARANQYDSIYYAGSTPFNETRRFKRISADAFCDPNAGIGPPEMCGR